MAMNNALPVELQLALVHEAIAYVQRGLYWHQAAEAWRALGKDEEMRDSLTCAQHADAKLAALVASYPDLLGNLK
jgi:hypothetical protein